MISILITLYAWNWKVIAAWCLLEFTVIANLKVWYCLIQQQEDQTNTKDNIPPIEEATERKPYGLRIF
jgi:hypothetical protein